MECILKEVVQLDKSGICPFAGCKCDGTMKTCWGREYALLPESKVCLTQGKHPVYVEITGADLEQVGSGKAVLMIKTSGGGTCFVKARE